MLVLIKGCFVVDFRLHDVIPTPQFQFGGAIGSTETVLVFRRIDR